MISDYNFKIRNHRFYTVAPYPDIHAFQPIYLKQGETNAGLQLTVIYFESKVFSTHISMAFNTGYPANYGST